MSLKITIKADEIAKQFKEFAAEVKSDIQDSIAKLASDTEAYVIDLAQTELKSSRDTFLDNLRYDEIAPGVHVISVLDKAIWIEEGLPQNFDMKPGMLNSPKAKTSKGENGSPASKYLIVPFKHTKGPSNSTPAAQDIIKRIRKNLAKEGLKTHKIEYNSDGSPRIGRLHSFSWGGNVPGRGNTGDLQRVSIYQTPDPTRKSGVRRDIFTFRTVSSNPSSANKWIHPGAEGKKFLDRAADWAMSEWENEILPQIMKKWEMK